MQETLLLQYLREAVNEQRSAHGNLTLLQLRLSDLDQILARTQQLLDAYQEELS